jgi:hypothetical protein
LVARLAAAMPRGLEFHDPCSVFSPRQPAEARIFAEV